MPVIVALTTTLDGMADTKASAEAAFARFAANYGAKYPKATECLAKDRAELLAFYDFPAEHWIHIRSSNVTRVPTVRLAS